ncbi:MAG: AMP-binding protein, partial [Bdellovibrionales bacterium]
MNNRALFEAATGYSVTHSELACLCREYAAFFAANEKQLLFLVASNRINMLAAYQGAIEAGHAVLLCDAAIPRDQFEKLCSAYRPSCVVAPREWAIPCASLSHVMHGVNISYLSSKETPALHPELSLLLSTSGSTGSSKMVRLSRRALEANSDQIVLACGIKATDRAAAHMPWHYSYGFSVIQSHLAAQASLVLFDDGLTSGSFWDAARKYGVTTLPGTPYHFSILERLGLTDGLLPSLRIITQAGGALDVRLAGDLACYMKKRHGHFYAMYGQTEAGPRMTVLPSDMAIRKAGSV